jgi:hypothetical protein
VVGFVLDRLMSLVEMNVNHLLNLPALVRRGIGKLFARTMVAGPEVAPHAAA